MRCSSMTRVSQMPRKGKPRAQTTLGESNLPNHQHDTQRILANLRVHELKRQINVLGLLILDPFVQIPSHKDNVILHPSVLGELGLEARLVQVCCEGGGDFLLVVFQTAKPMVLVEL